MLSALNLSRPHEAINSMAIVQRLCYGTFIEAGSRQLHFGPTRPSSRQAFSSAIRPNSWLAWNTAEFCSSFRQPGLTGPACELSEKSFNICNLLFVLLRRRDLMAVKNVSIDRVAKLVISIPGRITKKEYMFILKMKKKNQCLLFVLWQYLAQQKIV